MSPITSRLIGRPVNMPVLDAAHRVIGMVTQADLIAALFRAHGKTTSWKDRT
jgi:CBS-domain-containing membrane protein